MVTSDFHSREPEADRSRARPSPVDSPPCQSHEGAQGSLPGMETGAHWAVRAWSGCA